MTHPGGRRPDRARALVAALLVALVLLVLLLATHNPQPAAGR